MAIRLQPSPYGDVFEFLAAFMEFMQLDPPWPSRADPIGYLVGYYRALLEGRQPAGSGKEQRMALLMLYRLGLLRACKHGVQLDSIRVCPVVVDNPQEVIVGKILAWHPVKLLLRHLAYDGGSVEVEEVARELGCTVKRLTMELYDALLLVLKYAMSDERRARRVLETPGSRLGSVEELCGVESKRGVLKPFNRRRIRELLAPLLASMGLLRVISLSRPRLELTEAGWRAATSVMQVPQSEVVVTQPYMPVLYATLLSVFYKPSSTLYVLTPWVEKRERELLEKLLEVRARITGSNAGGVVIVVRDTSENRDTAKHLKAACSMLGLSCKILLLQDLRAKLYASTAALVTSANLLATSLWRNYEVGIYYPVTPSELYDLAREVESISNPV